LSHPVDLREFVSGFLIEADELLRAANANLLAVDEAAKKGETNPRAVRELFRSLHTIKGLAAMVEVEPIVTLAHAMEAVLRAADRAGGKLLPASIEQLLAGSKAIEQRVQALADDKPVPATPARLVEALEALEATQSPPTSRHGAPLALEPELFAKLTASEREQLVVGIAHGQRALRVDFIPSPARAAEGLTITTVRERVTAIAEIVKVLPVSLPRSDETPGGLQFTLLLLTTASDEAITAAAATPPLELLPVATEGSQANAMVPNAHPATANAVVANPADVDPAESDPWAEEPDDHERKRGGIVRVAVERLDDAMEKLSALIVTRFRFGRAIGMLAAQGVDVRALRQIEGEHGRQVRDLRRSILQLRMISTSEMLEPIPLIVRGLQASTGKAVRLVIDAGRGELDKAVSERVLPAIIHLIRNAVDHGIETREVRLRAGKPEEGLIKIACFERSNTQLELSVSDDGGGIDREAVARRAGREVPRTDAALLDLVVLSGLSTRDQVTKTSGRGVGMDIVKRITEELGGELLLRAPPGAGSTFTLRIPLTVTIVDAFAFECGAQGFVVPVAMVEEIIEVDRAQVLEGPRRRDRTYRASLIERRGEAVPLLRLDELFKLPQSGAVSHKALIVRRNGEPFAFAVDRMMGQQEIVVRPLLDPLVKVTGVSGVTDLGDGKPTLVLDLLALGGALLGRRMEVAA
jgi:two-component system chemotaxis sensor kinase CheA